MKILFLSSLYPPHTKGGGELSTHYIAQGLVARGHQVHVITSGTTRENVEINGVTVTRLPIALTAKPLLEQHHSRQIAYRLQPVIDNLGPLDILHAHDFRTAQALSELPYRNIIVTARDYAQVCGSTNLLLANGARCTCSLKDVIHNHRVAEASFPRNIFRMWQYWYNIGYRKSSFQKFPHQIFISHAEQKEIAQLQNLAHTACHVIYNPVDSNYLANTVKPTTKDLLYVGTVEDYKGVGLLLEAFHQIAATHPETHLRIVGDGADRTKYERQVAAWGLQYRVEFSGHIAWDKLREIYDNTAVVIAPHLWVEPFGRTVVEAMARSRVIVTANIGGPAELVQDNQTGFLFTRGSVDSLAKTIHRALTLRPYEYTEITNNANQWVNHNLSIDIIARQHEVVYQQIMADKK